MDTFTDVIRKYFVLDIFSTYRAIPSFLFVLLIAFFFAGSAVFFKRFERNKAFRMMMVLLLVEYINLLFSSTILFRNGQASFGHNYMPFWSYIAMFNGEAGLVVDNVMNVLAFLPIGFLLGCAIKRIKWWMVAMFACGCSIMIEATQLLMSRGFSELDDVFNNTLGAIIGYGLYVTVSALGKSFLCGKK